MGSGKSSVGRALSKKLKWDFIDSDIFIQDQLKLSITEIFQNFGEEYFRNLEREFIKKHQSIHHCIIATGGGMPIFNNVFLMGKVFFLDASFEHISHRLLDDNTRPLFQDKNKAHKLFLERQKIYKKNCDVIINANKSIQEIVEEILKNLPPDTYGT